MSAIPTPYSRQASFTQFQTEQAPTAGASLEAEFNRVRVSMDATQARLAEIQRDDGYLRNLSVHIDALSTAVHALLAIGTNGVVKGPWQTATVYAVKDVVSNSYSTYMCVSAHTSGTFATDLAAGKWVAIGGDYGSSLGSTLVGFLQSGTGATARTLQDKNREVVSPEDFGCVGDGVTDDTVNMQKALDALETAGGGTLRFARGKTYLTGYCTVSGNTIIDMNNGTWKAIAGLLANQSILTNKHYAGLAINATSDNNILIKNGLFLCTIAADRSTGLVEFYKCGSLKLENVRVQGCRHRGILIYGCKGAKLVDVFVTDYGTVAVNPESGTAIHITSHSDGSTSDDIKIIRPWITNGRWTGITASGTRVTIESPHITNVREAGIFGVANHLVINGGFIKGITKHDISASGIELGGNYITIGGGLIIEDTNNCSIALSDTQNVNIGAVTTVNARRDAVTYPTACHISILSFSASPLMPRDINISGHTAVDYSSPSTAAVRVEGSGAGSAMINLNISSNNYSATVWTGGRAVYVNPTYWTTANCQFSNNLGNLDTNRYVQVYLTGNQSINNATITALSFNAALANEEARWVIGSPTRITALKTDKRARFSGQVSFAANATGSRVIYVFKNGTQICTHAIDNAGASDASDILFSTPWFTCAAGDYFELKVLQRSGGALNVLFGGTGTLFQAEFV